MSAAPPRRPVVQLACDSPLEMQGDSPLTISPSLAVGMAFWLGLVLKLALALRSRTR